MSIRGKAYIMGAFEHPTRDAPDTSTPQLHAECAAGALKDAGLSKDDVDAYFCAGDAPGFGGLSMIDYMGLRHVRHAAHVRVWHHERAAGLDQGGREPSRPVERARLPEERGHRRRGGELAD